MADTHPDKWHVAVEREPSGATDAATGEPLTRDVVVARRTIGAFNVILKKDLASPIDGPQELHVVPDWTRLEDGELLFGGVTTDVLRSIPLAEARRLMEEVSVHALKSQDSRLYVPRRVDTPRDLALFAAVYVSLVDQGSTRPLERMSSVTGVSRNTLSARIRRARDRGLLTAPDESGLGRLTDEALRLINRSESE